MRSFVCFPALPAFAVCSTRRLVNCVCAPHSAAPLCSLIAVPCTCSLMSDDALERFVSGGTLTLGAEWSVCLLQLHEGCAGVAAGWASRAFS